MSVGTSSQRAARVAERKRNYNKPVRSLLKTRVKVAENLVAAGEIDQAQKAINEGVAALDRAAKKKVIHRNSAARRKSRLMRLLSKAKVSASEAKATEAAAKATGKAKTTTRKPRAKASPSKS